MEKYLKNPIILAIIVGAIAYILISYFYNPKEIEDKKSKKTKSKKSKQKTGFFTDKRETTILISVIIALGTWFLAKTYIVVADDNVVDIQKMDQFHSNMTNPLLVPGTTNNDIQVYNDQIGQNRQYVSQFQKSPSISTLGQNGQISQVDTNLFTQNNQMNQPIENNMNQSIENNMNQSTQPSVKMPVRSTSLPDPTTVPQSGGGKRSYNLIGAGLDIPRMSIPKVMVDYN